MTPKRPGLGFLNIRSSNMAATWMIAYRLFMLRLKERLEFDAPVLREIFGFLGLLLGFLCCKMKKMQKMFAIWSRVHASSCSSLVTNIVIQQLRFATTGNNREKQAHDFQKVFREHVEALVPTPQTEKFFDDPRRLLGPIAIVLKSRTPGEKGVISILYSYALRLFAKLFDIERIVEDYFLVLEPSWSGYCNLDILCYLQLDCPVFVQAYEPRDAEFIQSLRSNLIPVPVSNNWWVDHRIFKPVPNVTKDVDVIMVAVWADYKRHHEFFRSLMKLRKNGIVLKAVLIGYGESRHNILEAAEYYGVIDQLEIYESIPAEEVNFHLNRAKVNVIWSRREGVNRAVIEGLFAGTPCILRNGFNYGFHYPYINDSTGCFSAEIEFPAKLLWMTQNYQRFSTRAWVSQHMSCQRATEVLMESIKQVAFDLGEKWTENLAVKVNGLHGQHYWDSDDEQKFSSAYKRLRSCVRPSRDAR